MTKKQIDAASIAAAAAAAQELSQQTAADLAAAMVDSKYVQTQPTKIKVQGAPQASQIAAAQASGRTYNSQNGLRPVETSSVNNPTVPTDHCKNSDRRGPRRSN